MDFLGTVAEITSDGRAVVSASVLPEIGNPVFDSRKRRLGKVVRIFGPVDGPYVSVELENVNVSELAGADLYTQGVKQNGKVKRRH
ncbi:MAG: H/ACA ribonucleoprotein complex subunit GAR1 [Candidatus Methanomethylophilaceae archaeon]|jgi:rRNA processing protein Gar1|nr:RNA-binding protein [Candidatus Methanomethylophilaceae archaeon]